MHSLFKHEQASRSYFFTSPPCVKMIRVSIIWEEERLHKHKSTAHTQTRNCKPLLNLLGCDQTSMLTLDHIFKVLDIGVLYRLEVV